MAEGDEGDLASTTFQKLIGEKKHNKDIGKRVGKECRWRYLSSPFGGKQRRVTQKAGRGDDTGISIALNLDH